MSCLERVRTGMVSWLAMIWCTLRLLSERSPPMPRRHKPARPPRSAVIMTQIRQVYELDRTDARREIPRRSFPRVRRAVVDAVAPFHEGAPSWLVRGEKNRS